MNEEFEELEQIPWAALAATPSDSRAKSAAIAIAVAAVIGLAGWLVMKGEAAPTATLTTTAPPTTVVPVEVSQIETTTTAPVAAVYSEADLMLIDVADEERLAIVQAEWLVNDYLTVDDDSVVAARLEEVLPDVDRSEAASYVEWVRAFAVSSPEPGAYRVEVLYRVLVGGEDGFTRQPAAALAVDLAIDVDGTAQLLAAPEPVPVPILRGVEG